MKNVKESNMLIAKFMGSRFFEDDGWFGTRIAIQNNPNTPIEETDIYKLTETDLNVLGWLIFPSDMKYHKSWDWLMPVVEKIHKDLGHFIQIQPHSMLIFEGKHDTEIINHPFGYGHEESWIEVVYVAVVDFIKWYNKNKK